MASVTAQEQMKCKIINEIYRCTSAVSGMAVERATEIGANALRCCKTSASGRRADLTSKTINHFGMPVKSRFLPERILPPDSYLINLVVRKPKR